MTLRFSSMIRSFSSSSAPCRALASSSAASLAPISARSPASLENVDRSSEAADGLADGVEAVMERTWAAIAGNLADISAGGRSSLRRSVMALSERDIN